jgi:hypothetical protein
MPRFSAIEAGTYSGYLSARSTRARTDSGGRFSTDTAKASEPGRFFVSRR